MDSTPLNSTPLDSTPLDSVYQNKKLRIYTDGIFDLCHFGHGNVFKQIKEHFGNCVVIVGVLNDEDCHKHKGITVMNNFERVECLKFNKFIDEIVPSAPWIITEQFLDNNIIDYCAYHDIGIYNGGIDGHIVPKKLNRFFQVNYTNGISTTIIIDRILKNSKLYEQRNKNKI